MDLNYNKLGTLLGTSSEKVINHYITSIFRTISTKLGTLLDTSPEKLNNQYITSLFITLLTIACGVIGAKFVSFASY